MATSSPPPGTADIFPAEAQRWQQLERAAAEVFSRYGYGELRTPIFEYTEVFQRGLGDDTEVVQKEMYTFLDRGGRSLTLRPEGTAGVMRALLNTDVKNGVEQRVYYHGPMFRGERPAAGRRRQFHQIGVENAGRCAPELDAECIAMLMHFLEELGITGAELKINTRGVEADRGPAGELLREYFSANADALCPDCSVRLRKNIWRILDCKQTACRQIIDGAPDYLEKFTAESRAYFDQVTAALDALGTPYVIDRHLVRGLDYYVHTVFEITHPGLGAQNAIAGGGRYELFLPGESKPIQGVGFAAGIERLLMVQDALGGASVEPAAPPVFLVSLGESAKVENLKLAGLLRRAGVNVALEFEAKSMKAQMRGANRVGAEIAVIRGESELTDNTLIIKNMQSGEQRKISAADLPEMMKMFSRNGSTET
jgi:histidyl-tRNA synthetase